MSADRRRSERHSHRGAAKIQFGVGALPRDCRIIDISEGGLRALVENFDIPSEFSIILSEGRPRPCRLAWRIGCEFGAEFLDQIKPRTDFVRFKAA